MLEVLGSLNQDLVVYLQAFPAPGETVLAGRLERFLGGKGANQAVAAARLGVATRFLGFVGRDETGAALLAELAAEGVDVSGVVRTDAPTGVALIQVNAQGENAIAVVGGANRAALDLALPAAAPRVVLTQFETDLGVVERYLRGRGAAAWRILNAAPVVAEGARLFPLADVLVVNRGELAAYAGGAVAAAKAGLVDIGRSLLSRADQTLVVTLGAEGALAIRRDGVIRVAGRPARVVDTTGAGDCFCGALGAALAEGADVEAALGFATVAASLSVERAGAGPSMPGRAEVEARLGAA